MADHRDVPGRRARTRRRMRVVAAPTALLVVLGAGCATSSSTSPTTTVAGPTTSAPPPSAFTGVLVPTALPAGVTALGAVACPTAARCIGVGRASSGTGAAVTTADGGRSWTVRTVPAGVTVLSSVSCADGRRCAAAGQSGQTGTVVSTTDGGATWGAATLPPGVTDVEALSCRPDLRCTAVAVLSGHLTALVSGSATGVTWGATWPAAGPLPAGMTSAPGLACTDGRRCWAVGWSATDTAHAAGAGARTTDGGDTWTALTLPTGLGPLDGIWCGGADGGPAATGAPVSCLAAGTSATGIDAARTGRGVLVATTDGGGTWVGDPVPASVAALRAVTCDGGPCLAVGTTVASSAPATTKRPCGSNRQTFSGRSACHWVTTWACLTSSMVNCPSSSVIGH